MDRRFTISHVGANRVSVSFNRHVGMIHGSPSRGFSMRCISDSGCGRQGKGFRLNTAVKFQRHDMISDAPPG